MNGLSFKKFLPGAILLVSLVASTGLAQCQAAPAVADPLSGANGAGPNPKAVMMYNLGITAYKQGSTDAAVIFFRRACDLDPNLADAQYNLAVIFQAQRRFKEAIPRFEEVLRIRSNDPDAHFQMGIIMQDMGRYSEAKTHLSAIAPNNPHFSEAQRRMAQMDANPAPPVAGGQTFPQPPVAAFQAPPQQAPQATASNPDGTPNYPTPSYQSPAYQATPYPAPAYQTTQNNAGNNGYAAAVGPNGYPTNVNMVGQQPASATPMSQANSAANNGAPASATTGAASAPNPVPILPNTTLRVVATGFNAPAGLTFDRNGNLFVANYLINTIDRIAPDGTRSQFSSGTNLRGPIGLIADDAGTIYVANYNGGTVAKINPAGVSTVIATGFKKPYYLALDREGNLYVSQQEDNSIVRITLPRTTTAARTP